MTAALDSRAGSALDILAGLVLADGRLWGEAAMEFQWADARAVLEGPARLAYLTRPRGASKTTDLAGIAIAALLEQLPAGSRSYGLAADREQGQLLIDAMAGFVMRTPGLSGIKVDTWRATNTHTGATFDVLAADAAGAFGKLPHLLVVDERAQWKTTPEPERLWTAMFSALPKVPSSRLVILTTAGDPAHPAGRLIERARTSPRWYVNEVPGPTPWMSADDLAEQREELPEWEYARLVLNQWTASADRLTTMDDLTACVTLEGPLPHDPRWRYAVGVDLGITNDRTVVAVCHVEPIVRAIGNQPGPVSGQRLVLDRMQTWQGSRARPVDLAAVEEYLAEVSQQFNRPLLRFDPYQAVGMMQRLRARHVRCEEFIPSQASNARLGLTLHNLIRTHTLAIPADAELIDELANVRLREASPGVIRMDHDHGRHDDRAIALAIAAEHLLTQRHAPLVTADCFNSLDGGWQAPGGWTL